MRLALGVSRARLTAVHAVESVLLALLGGAAALLLAVWGSDLVRALLLPDLVWDPSAMDPHLLGFVLAASVAAGLLAGLLPAVQASRPDVMETLKSASRGATRRRSGLRAGLLVTQAALSVVLLVGTGLFVRSLNAARNLDLGFDPAPVLLVSLEPEADAQSPIAGVLDVEASEEVRRYANAERMTALYRRALEPVRGIGGVEAAALAGTVPMRSGWALDIRRPGEDSLPSELGTMFLNTVTPELFDVLDIRVLRGRALTEADDSETAPRVAVVSELMARRLWPDRDPLGACFFVEEQEACTTVVGVVEDSRHFELVEPEAGGYYLPMAQSPYPYGPRALLVRTAAEPAGMAAPVQRAIQAAIPDIRLVTARRYQDLLDPNYRAWSLGASLFAAFGLLALLVAAVGLYSLLAFSVAERVAEIGVRCALGASHQRIVGQVLRDGLRLTAFGVALGLAAAAATGPWIRGLLFDTTPYDVVVFGLVAAAMLLVATAASGIPAWRAARVDPAEALRAE